MARPRFLDICHVVMLMPTFVSSVFVLGFALLVYIYEIDIFELMILLLFIVPNMPSIYDVVDSVIVLGIIIVTKVRIYLTIQKPATVGLSYVLEVPRSVVRRA